MGGQFGRVFHGNSKYTSHLSLEKATNKLANDTSINDKATTEV